MGVGGMVGSIQISNTYRILYLWEKNQYKNKWTKTPPKLLRFYCPQEGIFANLLKLKMTRISKNYQVNLPEPLSQLELIKTHHKGFETWRLVFIRIIYLKCVIKIDTKSQYRNTAGVVPFQQAGHGFPVLQKTLWSLLGDSVKGTFFSPLRPGFYSPCCSSTSLPAPEASSELAMHVRHMHTPPISSGFPLVT